TLADALLAKTLVEILDGTPAGAMESAADAAAAVTRSGSAMQAVHTEFYLGWCSLLLGALADASQHYERALAGMSLLGDDFYEHMVLVGSGLSAALRGGCDGARQFLTAAKDAATRITNVVFAT